jgi:hypothetical protein
LVNGENFQDIDKAVGGYVDSHLNPDDPASLYVSVDRVDRHSRPAVVAHTRVAPVIEKTAFNVILGGEPRIPVGPDDAERNVVQSGFARVLRNAKDAWVDEPIPFLAAWAWINNNPNLGGGQSGLLRIIHDHMGATLSNSVSRGYAQEYAVAVCLLDFFDRQKSTPLKDTGLGWENSPPFSHSTGTIAQCYGDGLDVAADLRSRSHQPGFRPLIKHCDEVQDFIGWLENPDGHMFAIPPTKATGPGISGLKMHVCSCVDLSRGRLVLHPVSRQRPGEAGSVFRAGLLPASLPTGNRAATTQAHLSRSSWLQR